MARGRFTPPVPKLAPEWNADTARNIEEFLRSLHASVNGMQGLAGGDPTEIQAGIDSGPGVLNPAASIDHTHSVDTAAPSVLVALSGSPSEGTGSALMRASARLVLDDGGASTGDVLEWDGVAWVPTPGAVGGNIQMSTLAPSSNETITSGYGAYIPDYYEITDTKYLEISDGAIFEIG